jgi:arsenate reductase (thioredoxin)
MDAIKNKLNVLFLCTGNSCRSQMAEGWAKHLHSDLLESYSAGTEIHGLNPNAVEVMQEAGVDISNHKSKTTDGIKETEFDFVITVCDNAREVCPYFPARTKVIHQSFDDPPRLAVNAKNKEETLSHYRRVRDEIKEYILTLPGVVGL